MSIIAPPEINKNSFSRAGICNGFTWGLGDVLCLFQYHTNHFITRSRKVSKPQALCLNCLINLEFGSYLCSRTAMVPIWYFKWPISQQWLDGQDIRRHWEQTCKNSCAWIRCSCNHDLSIICDCCQKTNKKMTEFVDTYIYGTTGRWLDESFDLPGPSRIILGIRPLYNAKNLENKDTRIKQKCTVESSPTTQLNFKIINMCQGVILTPQRPVPAWGILSHGWENVTLVSRLWKTYAMRPSQDVYCT